MSERLVERRERRRERGRGRKVTKVQRTNGCICGDDGAATGDDNDILGGILEGLGNTVWTDTDVPQPQEKQRLRLYV